MGSDEFVRWLNLEVERRGWSFRELARRAGLSSGMISKVTTQQVMPSWEFCYKISQAFKLNPVVTFRLAGLMPPGRPKVSEEEAAGALIRHLSPDYRRFVITTLEALVAWFAADISQSPFPIPDDPLLQELISEYEQASEEERPGLIAMAKLWRTRPAEEDSEAQRQAETENA